MKKFPENFHLVPPTTTTAFLHHIRYNLAVTSRFFAFTRNTKLPVEWGGKGGRGEEEEIEREMNVYVAEDKKRE